MQSEIDIVKIPALIKRGKVRDVYDLGQESLLIVATDKISAFDSTLPTLIPGKGTILTQMSNLWFEKTQHIIDNHLLDKGPISALSTTFGEHYSELNDRSVVVKKCKPLAIEAIVRGYITGSGWKDYLQTGKVCGISLPKGLSESEKLHEPLFTPSTKADIGHDVNISYTEARDIVGEEIINRVRNVSLELYKFAADYALSRNIIIADTKFEFGLTTEGTLILIDEIFTPDSSRFWPLDAYKPGQGQPSFDKQVVRDYLESINWNKTPPIPELPEDIVSKTQEKYQQAMDQLFT